MRSLRHLLIVLSLALLALANGPCRDATGAIEGEGTIHQGVGPECPSTWHIATADGRMLWPVEDPAFQQDGLRVRFSVRERRDAASICMAGTMVEVVSLRRLP